MALRAKFAGYVHYWRASARATCEFDGFPYLPVVSEQPVGVAKH
jgi:hypothetical protein